MRRRHTSKQPPADPAAYRIRVQGCVDPRWSDWFSGLTLGEEGEAGGRPVTILAGEVPDQAALRGVLNKLWDMNLTLLTVERLAAPVESERSDERHAGLGANGHTAGAGTAADLNA
jgi:hypothetical protein